MNEIVGSHNILFVCLDCLRYDVAFEEQEKGNTPVLNQYGKWRKCQAPGNFTYPSHQAMFAGFMPIDEGILDMKKREKLFFSEDIGMGTQLTDVEQEENGIYLYDRTPKYDAARLKTIFGKNPAK